MSIGGGNILDRSAGVPQRFLDPMVFVGRALMAYIFIVDGYGAVVNYSGVGAYMQSYGVTPLLLPLVIAVELGGGLLVLAGLAARWAAAALAAFSVLTALIFHSNGANADETIHFQKDLAIAGGFLILTAFGPGAWSLDGWRIRRKDP